MSFFSTFSTKLAATPLRAEYERCDCRGGQLSSLSTVEVVHGNGKELDQLLAARSVLLVQPNIVIIIIIIIIIDCKPKINE